MLKKVSNVLVCFSVIVCVLCPLVYAQGPDITFEKVRTITLFNELDISRQSETITISLQTVREHIPDFNHRSFRLIDPDAAFEPADIPSQIRMMPGQGEAGDALVFQMSFAPGEKRTVEIWYNSSGIDHIEYPPRTQSSDTWYRPSTTLIWENEQVMYRSYNGIVDFFGKTYPHLRLHDLENDSYHHEQSWGIDPYIVGDTPGIGGILLLQGGKKIPCYGADTTHGRSYRMQAFEGGPVAAGGVVDVIDGDKMDLSIAYELSADHVDNMVHARAGKNIKGQMIAPGMQILKGAELIVDEKAGYMIAWGAPVEEYGTIGTALVWNPAEADGLVEYQNGLFIAMLPDAQGEVSYRSMAVWSRATADQPDSPEMFVNHVKLVARKHLNPVQVTFD